MSKQKSLYLGIMSYVHDLIQEGELARVKSMGFDQDMIERVSKLSMAELNEICNRRACLFDIQASEVMARFLKDVGDAGQVDKCILAGAPNDFLYRFFGLTSKAASTRRFILRLNVRQHRRIPANSDQEGLIMDIYHTYLKNRHIDDLEPSDFLALHKLVNEKLQEQASDDEPVDISLKVIWGVVNRYHELAPVSIQGNGKLKLS
ncbi:MAG: DUF2857 domain-containing protein [Methyloprofundus sp.]|nr:DUF2857 domain-containing protein [Methyloprofundus sp.]